MPVTDLVIEAKPRWSGTIGAGGVAESTTTTIPLSSAANLDDGDIYIFTVNRVTSDGTKNSLSEMETVIGELSGTSFINCVRGLEGTAQAWDAGTVVEILFTAAHWNKLKEAWETEHSQDGTHSAVTATTITTTGAVDAKTLKINAGTAMTAVLDEDTMSSDSATALATQQSIKAYVGNITSEASSATPTPTGDRKVNEYYATALEEAAEFAEPSGTPANGNKLFVRVLDDGTARALTYNAIYTGIVGTLPDTTTISKSLFMLFVYNSEASKWEMLAVTEES